MMTQTSEPERAVDPAIIAARNSEPLPPIEDIPGISGKIVTGSGGRIELTPRSSPTEDHADEPKTSTEPKLEIPDLPATPDMFGKRVDDPVIQVPEPPKKEEPPTVAEPVISLDILKEMAPPKLSGPAVPLEPMRPVEPPQVQEAVTPPVPPMPNPVLPPSMAAPMAPARSNPAMPPSMTEPVTPARPNPAMPPGMAVPMAPARPNPAMPPGMAEPSTPVARPNPAMPPTMSMPPTPPMPPTPAAPTEPKESQTSTPANGDFPQGEFLKMFPNARPD